MNPEIPIILCSGNVVNILKAESSGIDYVLQKPITLKDLSRALNEVSQKKNKIKY
jgi:CheY-like chemotaxis protein